MGKLHGTNATINKPIHTIVKLVELPTPTQKLLEQQVAESLLNHLNAELTRRVEYHVARYREFWSRKTNPDIILEKMGEHALIMLLSSRENIEHIGKLAAIVGKQVTDFMPVEMLNPPRDFVVEIIDGEPTGKVTLTSPKFGHDAWNQFIPVPEDPYRVGYDENNNPVYGYNEDGSPILDPPVIEQEPVEEP